MLGTLAPSSTTCSFPTTKATEATALRYRLKDEELVVLIDQTMEQVTQASKV